MPGRPALILAGLIWTATAVGGGPVLYLRTAAVLPAGELSLGAIADVRSDDPREAAALAALGLGPVPARAAFLPPQEVRRRVERSWAGRADVVGAGVALLPEVVVPARQQARATALLAALGRASPAGEGWLEVDFLSPLPESAGEAAISVSLPRGERPSGRMQVLLGEAGILVFVHPFAAVARAARDLPRDRLLDGEDVEFVPEDLSGLRGGYLTAADLRGSFRLLAPVPRGARLEPSRLARNLLVKAGERVTVLFVRPALSITLSGKAWGSAGPGETVEVSLRDPTRRFRGTVSETGEVVVEQL
jgi:flagella basal body P-ring formation protein FlgA